MSAPVKVPLKGGQVRHLDALLRQANQAQALFEAASLAIASGVELPEGVRYKSIPMLDGPEPHILLTPAEPPKPEKKP